MKKIGKFPLIIRPAFTLGGTGGGIGYNQEEFEAIAKNGIELSPVNEILIEESLLGWKEYEMEVMRDQADNCVIICSIENFDPMGVHTGDSITVAPIQTLTDKEFQIMRDQSSRRHPRRGRGDRRLEHPVRRQPGEWPHGHHRDEPACEPKLGPGFQSDRLSHREDRRQTRRRLPARRTQERHHARNPRELRAEH